MRLVRFWSQRPADQTAADLLESCLARIERGEATLESCLAEHPQQAAQLRPLLTTALATRSAMAAAELAPATRARLRARVLAATAPRPMPAARRPIWQPAAAAALALLLLAVLTVPVSMLSSDNAVPGDWNYGMKRAGERVRLALTVDDRDRRDVHLAFAEQRTRELQALIQQDRIQYVPDLLRDLNRERSTVTELNKGTILSLGEAKRFEALYTEQEQVLARVKEAVEETSAAADVRPSVDEALTATQAARREAAAAVERQTAAQAQNIPQPTPTPAPTPRPNQSGISDLPMTPRPSASPEASPEASPAPTPGATPAPSATPGASPAPSSSPAATAQPSPSASPVATPPASVPPSGSPAPVPTVNPSAAEAQARAIATPPPVTLAPVPTATPAPTPVPTPVPTPTPSSRVSDTVPNPSAVPSATPTPVPTLVPAQAPPAGTQGATPQPQTAPPQGTRAFAVAPGAVYQLTYTGPPQAVAFFLAPLQGKEFDVRITTPDGLTTMYRPGDRFVLTFGSIITFQVVEPGTLFIPLGP